MPRFFVDMDSERQVRRGEKLYISGADAHHIAKVLRMRPGDNVTLCSGTGNDFECRILSLSPEETEFEVLSVSPSESEPHVRVTLYASVTKGDRMDYLVQKSVETGVWKIVPVMSKRCVFLPDEKARRNRLQRWNRIAYEAAKQSGRGIIPEVADFMDFNPAVEKAAKDDLGLIAYEKERGSLRAALENRDFDTLSVFTGPEGGFEPEEVTFAGTNGIIPVSLGRRILRAETAPVVALAAVFYQTGDM